MLCQGRACEVSVFLPLTIGQNPDKIGIKGREKTMALLMVHLLVAQRWAAAHEQYRGCPEFYLGAISPDAIHVRDKDDKSHKNEIHLNNWTVAHPEDVLEYWRTRRTPFDIGYGVHVLTDAQWVPRFRSAFPQMIHADGKVDVATYYNDTFITDYGLYHDCEGVRLFDLVERATAPSDHPLLTQYELQQWQRQMVAAYRGECPKHEPVRWIDREFVDAFIDDSQELLNKIWGRHEHE